MDTVRVTTEDPEAEQWRRILQFSYPSNIRRFFHDHPPSAVGAADPGEVENCVAGCVRQGEAYFSAAKTAPVDISPLLYYYGTSNLMRGAAVLRRGCIPSVTDHGMKLILPGEVSFRVADVAVRPVNPATGALQVFAGAFPEGANLAGVGELKVGEIFSLVPELKQEFENCYQSGLPNTIPLQLVAHKVGDHVIRLDRVSSGEMRRFESLGAALSSVPGYETAYLPPQRAGDWVILNHKIGRVEIASLTVTGQRYLVRGKARKGAIVPPPSLPACLLMGLFALGYVSRYHPERWMPFIRNDETGERLVVERFLAVCRRVIPNLVLNLIGAKRVEFVYGAEHFVDLTQLPPGTRAS
jgi:hypothetical protein